MKKLIPAPAVSDRIAGFFKSKAILGALGVGTLILTSLPRPAGAALQAYDGFTNAPGGNIIGAGGGTGFMEDWQANGSAGVAYYTNFSLGYTDASGNVLVTSGNAGFFQGPTAASGAMQPNRAFSFTNGLVNETKYISLLMVRQGPTNGSVGNPYPRGVNATFDYPTSSGGANQRSGIGNSSGAATNTLGILSNGGNIRSSINPPYQFGGSYGPYPPITNFVVLRYELIGGDTTLDNAYLWVNPTNLAVEPPISSATTNVLGLYDYTMNRWRMFVGGLDSGNNRPYGEIIVDELRIGDTWADVTPHTSSGGGVIQPRWTNVQNLAGSMHLTLTGGLGSNYVIEVSSTVTNASGWASNSMLQLNGSGVGTYVDTDVVSTNNVRYYRARSP